MKICIIGNSHIAALKLALTAHLFEARNDLDLTFWGLRGTEFLKITYQDGRLVAPDPAFALFVSEGRFARLDPNGFQAIIFHGKPVSYTPLLRALRRYQGNIACYTAAFLREGVHAYFDELPTCDIIRQLRSAYKGRVIVSAQPLVSERSKSFDGNMVTPKERVTVDAILQNYFSARYEAEYLPQPAHTIVENCYTAVKFSSGSIGLGGKAVPDDDISHMNGLYGAEVLRAAMQLLGHSGADGNE